MAGQMQDRAKEGMEMATEAADEFFASLKPWSPTWPPVPELQDPLRLLGLDMGVKEHLFPYPRDSSGYSSLLDTAVAILALLGTTETLNWAA